ncbi:MAG: universal stress protein [Desulfobacterales bacterium]|nr:universal stress protein [Desulfobacterales bacterium]
MYKKIMVPLDGSKLAECILPHIEAFISGCQLNTIVFVRVTEPVPVSSHGGYQVSEMDYKLIEENTKRIKAERISAAEKYLKGVVNRLKHSGVKFQTEVLVGNVADKPIDYSEANGVDMIFIATHGRSGVSRWVRGSIADRILRASRVPVLMLRAPGTLNESKA